MARNIRENNTLGIVFMLIAIFMFAVNDVLGKWLVASYHVGLLLFVRSIAAILFLCPFILYAGPRSLFDVAYPKLMAVRVLLTAIEISCFYYSVGYMPLADAITFWMASPIYVAALSPLLLGEHVGWRRWTAIIVGFIGVLIAMRPSSESLSLPSIAALVGSLAFALMMITARALRNSSDIAMVFWPTTGTALLGIILLPWAKAVPAPVDFVMLSMLGIIALVAHVFTNRSLMLADAATVTPYQYTLLLWAMIFGWLVFNETPQITTMIGAALIVASGLFIFFREQKLGIGRAPPTDIT
ncbi:MAG: DMT family transporter [Rhizobiaceae bacterium]|nr:DMT family transporter [Rhizobiaceae bacterium]